MYTNETSAVSNRMSDHTRFILQLEEGLKVVIVRHGEACNNIRGLDLGPEPPLTRFGVLQAEATGEELRNENLDLLFCSPQARALQTASIIGERLNLRPQALPDLRETTSGPEYPGMTASQIRERYPQVDPGPGITESGWWFHGGGESPEDIERRAARIRDWLIQHFGSGTHRIGLVAHCGISEHLVRFLMGVPLGTPGRHYHANCCITRLYYAGEGGWILDQLNSLHHLRQLEGNRTEASFEPSQGAS